MELSLQLCKGIFFTCAQFIQGIGVTLEIHKAVKRQPAFAEQHPLGLPEDIILHFNGLFL